VVKYSKFDYFTLDAACVD